MVARTLSSHNLPSDRARELFKPSKNAGNLVASIKQIRELFGLNSYGGDVVSGWGSRDLGMTFLSPFCYELMRKASIYELENPMRG